MPTQPTIRFATIGLNHGHIYDQTRVLLQAGAELVWVYAPEADLLASYQRVFPQAVLAPSVDVILEDRTIDLVISAGIPCDRAPLGVQVMRHGKDYMVDKPGVTSLAQLEEVRQVQRETGRIYSIYYSERLGVRASVKAGDLVHAGAIGQVVQVAVLAPHHERPHTRPAWFYDPAFYGGILTDIGSHQFDQVLYYTGSTAADVALSQVANFHHPQHPLFEDFGDAVVRGNGGMGYLRVDWFTPEGLGTWGDGRLTIIGTDGYIEARKYVDIAGRPGGDHLFLIDQKGTNYINCQDVELPYARQLIDDIVNRSETAMSHAHCFLASELTLLAQTQAHRLGHLKQGGQP
jgi:predicted dehydrogenase